MHVLMGVADSRKNQVPTLLVAEGGRGKEDDSSS